MSDDPLIASLSGRAIASVKQRGAMPTPWVNVGE